MLFIESWTNPVAACDSEFKAPPHETNRMPCLIVIRRFGLSLCIQGHIGYREPRADKPQVGFPMPTLPYLSSCSLVQGICEGNWGYTQWEILCRKSTNWLCPLELPLFLESSFLQASLKLKRQSRFRPMATFPWPLCENEQSCTWVRPKLESFSWSWDCRFIGRCCPPQQRIE